MNNEIKLPCKIGDIVYIVEDYNPYYDKCEYCETIYGSKIVVKDFVVDSFIIDSKGVSIAEDGHDGYNKLITYHSLTLEEYEDCKVFYNKKDALEFVKSIRK